MIGAVDFIEAGVNDADDPLLADALLLEGSVHGCGGITIRNCVDDSPGHVLSRSLPPITHKDAACTEGAP